MTLRCAIVVLLLMCAMSFGCAATPSGRLVLGAGNSLKLGGDTEIAYFPGFGMILPDLAVDGKPMVFPDGAVMDAAYNTTVLGQSFYVMLNFSTALPLGDAQDVAIVSNGSCRFVGPYDWGNFVPGCIVDSTVCSYAMECSPSAWDVDGGEFVRMNIELMTMDMLGRDLYFSLPPFERVPLCPVGYFPQRVYRIEEGVLRYTEGSPNVNIPYNSNYTFVFELANLNQSWVSFTLLETATGIRIRGEDQKFYVDHDAEEATTDFPVFGNFSIYPVKAIFRYDAEKLKVRFNIGHMVAFTHTFASPLPSADPSDFRLFGNEGVDVSAVHLFDYWVEDFELISSLPDDAQLVFNMSTPVDAEGAINNAAGGGEKWKWMYPVENVDAMNAHICN